MESNLVLVSGKRVRRRKGDHPIVFVHGVGMDLTMWDEVACRLPAEFDVVCYDMIGHGPGPHPAGPYGIADFVGQSRAILDALGIKRCTLVGFSMGGMIALEFALRFPGRVRDLVILNSVFDRSDDERRNVIERADAADTAREFVGLQAGIERWFTPGFRANNTQIVDRVSMQMAANDLKAFAAAYRVFATADTEQAGRVRTIGCRTLVATGEDDQRSTPDMAARLAAAIPGAEYRILEGQRHLTPIEIPGEVADMISRFVLGSGNASV